MDNDIMCPYCMGTGRMKQRCLVCRGSGLRSMMPRIYCDECPLGKDLEHAERKEAEERRNPGPDYPPEAPSA